MSEHDDIIPLEPETPKPATRAPTSVTNPDSGTQERAAKRGSEPKSAAKPNSATKKRPRLLSLDAFRGFDIAAMLFVNMTWNREVFHPQLFHIDWNDPAQGATFTDLVFPWFLFIAGCAIPLSMESGRGRAMPWWRKVLSAFRRGLVIYLLGTLLTVASAATDRPLVWADLLSWNILQLIGVGYFVAVCVFLLPKWFHISFVAAVLLLKLGVMTLIPYEMVAEWGTARAQEGAPTGASTWAHFHGVRAFLTGAGMEAGWLKTTVGWFGMAQQFLPCAAIAVMGGLTTRLLVGGENRWARTGLVLLLGVGLTALAYVLQWGYTGDGAGLLGRFTVPFSKWFFSPSYCLLAAGTGAILFAAFHVVCDLIGQRIPEPNKLLRGLLTLWPLRVYGLNAIALYVGAELSFKVIFSKWQIIHPNGASGNVAGGFIAWVDHAATSLSLPSPAAWGGWVFVLTWLGMWWLFCWYLERNRIVIKV